MKRSLRTVLVLLSPFGAMSPCFAGSYYGIATCSISNGCSQGRELLNGALVDERGITYPLTFVENGISSPNIRICVIEGFNGNLSRAVQWAVSKWNALVPGVNNCARCVPQELIDTVVWPKNLANTVLHELGHAAMGLGHTTLIIDTADDPDTCSNPPPEPIPCREFTSYTVSYGGTSNFGGLLPGADGVKGSKDDTQLSAGGMGQRATNVSWFRRADNDPIIYDFTPIDSSTYSPALNELPAGSTYTANSNIGVGALLGYPHTESVMMRRGYNNTTYFDISADDVNMVEMSRTGLNRAVGPSGPGNDDHNIQLEIVSCSDAHDIEVSATLLPEGVLGISEIQVKKFSPAVPIAYQIIGVVDPNLVHVGISTDPEIEWKFEIPIFYGSFDSGTIDSGWTLEIP